MKKLLFLICFASLILACNKEKKSFFEIKGTANENWEGKQVVLITETGQLQDTTTIKNQKFTFKGSVSEPISAAIQTVNTEAFVPFLLINDKITIKIPDSKYKTPAVKYEKSQAAYDSLLIWDDKVYKFIRKMMNMSSEKAQCKDYKLKRKLLQKEDSISVGFIQEQFKKYDTIQDKSLLPIIVSSLTQVIGTRQHPNEIHKLYELLSEKEKNGFYGKKAQKYFAHRAKTALGNTIDLELTDINNKTYKLSDFKGKYVLLEFWASYCGPCIAQFPKFEAICKKNKNLQIITVSIDKDIEKWKNKVNSLKMNWINIHCKQKNKNIRQLFNINGVPNNILISDKGIILKKHILPEELAELLSEKTQR